MTTDSFTSLSPRRVRARLAVGLTISALAVAAVVAVAATALAAWQAGDDGTTQAGAARVGDEVTVVIVTDEGAAAAAAGVRTDTLRWSLIALAASIIPAVGVGWFAAGRLLGTVDQALAEVEAEDAERQRRLQEVVHELRTPLAVMGTNLELAATEPGLEPDPGRLIDAARRAIDRLGRTVDDLAGHGGLAVSADAGAADLAQLANEVGSEHAGPAHARGLHLVIAGAGPVAVSGVDPAAVRAVLGNLVTNAVRLAPRGSKVTLDWGETTGWAWISVGDEGPGLPIELHARVFERGWRGRHERDRADATDRAGLGLTIARQLTEAQGGVVTLESDEGAGSTFAVWLPLSTDGGTAEIVDDDGVHPTVRPWHEDLVIS
jgi:signal transduction histidine kinase